MTIVIFTFFRSDSVPSLCRFDNQFILSLIPLRRLRVLCFCSNGACRAYDSWYKSNEYLVL